jgi:hypothetical protein
VLFKVSVANKPIMLNVIMLSVIRLSVIRLSVIMLSVVMMNVVVPVTISPCYSLSYKLKLFKIDSFEKVRSDGRVTRRKMNVVDLVKIL